MKSAVITGLKVAIPALAVMLLVWFIGKPMLPTVVTETGVPSIKENYDIGLGLLAFGLGVVAFFISLKIFGKKQ